MRKRATVFASISGCIAVILGAFGAHKLGDLVSDVKLLHAYDTATHYQLFMSIALLAIVALPAAFTKYFKTISYLFMIGIVLFSGSIYLLVLGDIMKFNAIWAGPITPLGGLSLIAGWFMLFLSALKYKEPINNEQK